MEFMKRARKRRNMTQTQLGKIIGLSVSAVSMYETGKRIPPVSTAKAIGKILNVSWKRFYDEVS